MGDEKRLMAGDIGGTKTYLALFSLKDGVLELDRGAVFVNAGYGGPEEIIDKFLEGEGRLESAAFGLACPVENNRCTLTNLNWVVDGPALRERFGIGALALVNDLVAIGWGIGLLSEEDFSVLQAGIRKPGNAALIAAGTGLGEAMLFWDGLKHLPSPSEGGHVEFGPRNELEIELLRYLAGKYGHVSYERIVSGPGLENIYEFMAAKQGNEPQRLKARFMAEGIASVVSDEAMNGTDRNCRDALSLFTAVYGAEAGNLALKTMSLNGVYLGGGITPKILKSLSSGNFMEAFRDKGRFGKLMSEIPVYAILNDRTGLMGAANYAAGLVLSGQKPIRKIIMPRHI